MSATQPHLAVMKQKWREKAALDRESRRKALLVRLREIVGEELFTDPSVVIDEIERFGRLRIRISIPGHYPILYHAVHGDDFFLVDGHGHLFTCNDWAEAVTFAEKRRHWWQFWK